MKTKFKFALSILTIAALIGFQSCQKEDLKPESNEVMGDNSPAFKSASTNVFYSHSIPIGNGVARAWVKTDKQDNPLAVGVNFTAKALENLPDHPMQYVLPLPKNKGHNFYTHALFDWNPHGHEPPGIYDKPHFDFHFYISTNELRTSIPFLPPPAFDTPVDPMYVPEDYVQLPGLVPEMGAHWVDMFSPELPPTFAPFTKTFIWGSYSGEFIFWEPMITREYLLTMPDEIVPIKQPLAYEKDGWYPENYQITYSESPNSYTVALVDLTWHDGE